MLLEYLKIAIQNITHRGIRSWLTMIGIFIGVALFVSLISLGQGLQNAINEQFDMMGSDKVIIQTSSGAPGSSTLKFSEKEKEIATRSMGIKNFAAYSYKMGRIEFKDNLIYNYLIGMPLNEEIKLVKDINDYDVVEGRWIKNGDKYKANIGYDYAHVENIIGPDTLAVGDKLIIEEKEFDIVGVMDRVGNPGDDRSIFIPLDTYDELYGISDEYDAMLVQVKKGVEPSDVADDIKKDLRKYRDEEIGEESFSVETSENFRESFNDIFNIVNYFVAGLAFISLLVGAVGIMNTMYTSVLERTKVIGIMKAIGARNSDILNMFLMEAGMIGLVGGIVGIIFGFLTSKFVEFVIKAGFGFDMLSVKFNTILMLVVMLGSVLFGAFAGMLPAKQAASQKPVDALRYE